MKTILNETRALCAEIEKWPASEQQTKVSVMAAGIAQKLQANEADLTHMALAKGAISYALRRVGEDENIRYHMGCGTEAFERLVKAHAALHGMIPKTVENLILQRKSGRKSNTEIVREIKDVIDGSSYAEKGEVLGKIKTILEAA